MTDKKLFIGFTGYAGAGKDYVADLISNALFFVDSGRIETTKVPWAAGVRRDIEKHINGDRDLPSLWEKPTPPAVRRLLQWWGTEFRRGQDPDFWVKWGIESAADTLTPVTLFTDTRFENEVDAITDAGGLILNIRANEEARIDRIGVTPSHASEALANSLPAHLVIHNDGYHPPRIAMAVDLIRRKVREL
jgi:hypothetical protein